ncbi:hypothetical protein C7M84_021342 [Penaeus vannamei]|uniref:Uncharacterized protein n=1 Tax=Penaeus vannamei TaxID=6689 RepID=A0A423U8T5_PENVA|nr:hypothetical protein C7M84_021342 [Penaeus vannamei]
MVERCWRAWACALVLVGVAEGVASQRDLTLPLLQEEAARFPVFFSIPEPRAEPSKRQSFSAWGGKRASWHPALRSGSGLPLSLRDIYLHLFKQARRGERPQPHSNPVEQTSNKGPSTARAPGNSQEQFTLTTGNNCPKTLALSSVSDTAASHGSSTPYPVFLFRLQ